MCSPPSGTHRDSELDREEMGEKRDRGHLVEKKESPEEERVVKPVIRSQVNLGGEVWVFKCTKLTTKT